MKKDDKIELIVSKFFEIFHIKLSSDKRKLFVQIFKFIIVGGCATIIDWFIYFILYNYLNFDPLIANICSFSISVIYNYYASVKWVFDVKNNKSKKRMFFEFIILSIIGLIMTEGMIYVGVNVLKFSAMIIKVLATAIVMVFNYVTRKLMLE